MLIFFAIAVVLGAIAFSANDGLLAWDVRFAYLPASDAVLDGVSPYPQLDDPILEDQKGYVYPPQLALLLVPLTVLPTGVASMLAALSMLALVGLTLWVLDVRDPRCFAAAALWVPTISGVLLSNLSIPLDARARCCLALPGPRRDPPGWRSVWPSRQSSSSGRCSSG